MDMDATAIIDFGSTLAKLPYQRLNRFDVIILADWGHHFYRVQAACCSFPSGLTADAAIADYLPPSATSIANCIGIIAATHMRSLCSKMLCDYFRCGISGDASHLDFNAKVLISQTISPPRFSPWYSPTVSS